MICGRLDSRTGRVRLTSTSPIQIRLRRLHILEALGRKYATLVAADSAAEEPLQAGRGSDTDRPQFVWNARN
jgi:hypothetical protein